MRVLVSVLLIILCMGGADASEWQTAGTDIAGLFDQLRNGSTSSEAASKVIKLGREDRTVRKYISEHLPALIEGSGGDIKTNAIRIAASLKVESAVPALVAMLRYFSLAGRTDMGATMRMENDPAGKALVQIGEPSVDPVAQVLEQGNRQARWRAALILMSIGTPAAIRAVRSHIPKENDPHLRPFMEGLFKRERAPKGVGKAVLDLTAPTPKGEQLTSLAGAHAGVIGGIGLVPRPYRLPLAVKLMSISPRQFAPGGRLLVAMVLKNVGPEPYYLPASLKHVTVLKQGNKGRRTLLFSLVLENAKQGSKLSSIVGASDGSESAEGSFIRLDPQQLVRVLLAGRLNSTQQEAAISQWIRAGITSVNVRARVTEWTYEDKRYFIENEAEPVFSDNAIPLKLALNK